MVLLLLEALAALLILVFIVWWTMFSGRESGELKKDPAAKEVAKEVADAPKLPAPSQPSGSQGPQA